MRNKNIILIILIIIGIYFFSSGITGLVISGSCCFSPDCPEENLCKNINYFEDTKYISTTIGIVIFLAVIFLKISKKS